MTGDRRAAMLDGCLYVVIAVSVLAIVILALTL